MIEFYKYLPGVSANKLTEAFTKRVLIFTTQKMKFSIKDFFSKCDQIRSFLQI